jgi:ABC-type amino acid transport substrate-binding protein
MRDGTFKTVTVLALALALYASVKEPRTGRGTEETALAHVTRTGVLRCGYTTWAPYFSIDPKTGEKGGIAYDFLQALGQELGVRVDWVEEAGWGNLQEGLDAKRYDMFCVPLWGAGARARVALLTRPVYDDGLYAFARADDPRFDQSLDQANNAGARIVVMDGDTMQKVRQARFPKAQELALAPMLGDESQAILSVVQHKADIVFNNLYSSAQYNEKAEAKIKAIGNGEPVRLFASSFAVKLGESDFKAAVDVSLEALCKSGEAEKIVKKYQGFRLAE